MSRRESWASIAAKLDGTECAEELRVELELAVTRIEELEARLSAPVDEGALREAIVGVSLHATTLYLSSAERIADAVMAVLREAGLLRPEVER